MHLASVAGCSCTSTADWSLQCSRCPLDTPGCFVSQRRRSLLGRRVQQPAPVPAVQCPRKCQWGNIHQCCKEHTAQMCRFGTVLHCQCQSACTLPHCASKCSLHTEAATSWTVRCITNRSPTDVVMMRNMHDEQDRCAYKIESATLTSSDAALGASRWSR